VPAHDAQERHRGLEAMTTRVAAGTRPGAAAQGAVK
jgi:hypothetical protein